MVTDPAQNDHLTVLTADSDLSFARHFENLCSEINGLQCLGLARSGPMLLAKMKNFQADLVFLGLDPSEFGTGVIEALKRISPEVTIILLYPARHDPDVLVEALEAGAYECLEKPDPSCSLPFNEFRLHILTITGLLRSRKRFFKARKQAAFKSHFFMPADREPDQKPLHSQAGLRHRTDLVVLAASTGGPEILSRIFSILPGHLKVPVLLVQHIPAEITALFAQSLNRKSELEIIQAVHGVSLSPGRVYLAPGGRHMTLSGKDDQGRHTLALNTKPAVNGVRPSADVLFESIARRFKGHVLAVVLTGMGEDGRQGISLLKQKSRCTCLTQEAGTCVVYGMPRAIDEAGLSDESLDPLAITEAIVRLAG